MGEQNSAFSVWSFITVVFSAIFALTIFVTNDQLPEFTKILMYLSMTVLLIGVLLTITAIIKKEKGFLKYCSFIVLLPFLYYFLLGF